MLSQAALEMERSIKELSRVALAEPDFKEHG
jgi:hypothetical protein